MDTDRVEDPVARLRAHARSINEACERYESAWREGCRPRIEDTLAGVPQPGRAALFRELLLLELELRRVRGEHPGPREYLERFPDLNDLVDAAFAEATAPVPGGVAHAPRADPLGIRAADGEAGPARDHAPTRDHDARFRVLSLYDRGNLGEVLRAFDKQLGRVVALKHIQDYHADRPESRARFLLEAEVTGGLEHPGIVPVYALGYYGDGRPYYAMRLVRGGSLREAIDEFHTADVPERDPSERVLALRGLLRRLIDACNAVAYAHSRGVLHRDLKPDHVMLGDFGETLVVDWGVAKVTGRADGSPAGPLTPSSDAASETQTGATVGSPAYMSPEQAAGDAERLGPASDVYSLGATLYCLLTGRPPFEGDNPLAVAYQHVREDPEPPSRDDRSLTPAMDAVVLKAMAKNPANRYQSAEQMREDLLRAAAGQPVEATPLLLARSTTILPGGSRRTGVRRGLVYGLFGMLLLGIVVGLGLAVKGLLDNDSGLVTTPAVVGLAQADAQIRLAEAGLTVGDVARRFDEKPLNTVLEQSPVGGILVDAAGRIDLVVSQGVEMAVVPQVVGQSRAEATAQLEQAKLAVRDVIERGGNISPGQVLEVIPTPGTQLRAGAQVTLVVSSGRVEVPLVVGRTQAEAEQLLQRAGFSVGVRLVDDVGEPGRVLGQDPVNTTAVRGSTVVIRVSQVPPPPPPPPPSPTPEPTPLLEPSPSPSPSPPSATPPATDAPAPPPTSSAPTSPPPTGPAPTP